MIIWQVDWNKHDRSHKLFVLADDSNSWGRSKSSSSMAKWDRALARGRYSYYFYMEFIK